MRGIIIRICASPHAQEDLKSGDSEGAVEAVASALAGSFAKAGCDIEASVAGKDTGVPAEYTASLLGEEDDGAMDSRSEDDRSSLLGVVEVDAHAARKVEGDARNTSPNIAVVERARAANKGRRGSRLSH